MFYVLIKKIRDVFLRANLFFLAHLTPLHAVYGVGANLDFNFRKKR